METRRFRPRLIEVVVVLAGILVAVYAAYVIRNVGATTPDDGASPPAPVETISESPAPTPPKPTAPPRPAELRASFADARTVLVVGDSTGDSTGEWVDLWANDLALDREVRLRQWGLGAPGFSADPVVSGNGRPPMEIWNLSYPGVAADYAPKLADVETKPDVAIISIGHDRSRQAIRRAIRTTTAAIETRWGDVPTAWVLQNPSTEPSAQAQEQAVKLIRSLAVTEQVPVIDVHAQFLRADDLQALLVDDSLPNDAGSRLWADTVQRILG